MFGGAGGLEDGDQEHAGESYQHSKAMRGDLDSEA